MVGTYSYCILDRDNCQLIVFGLKEDGLKVNTCSESMTVKLTDQVSQSQQCLVNRPKF